MDFAEYLHQSAALIDRSLDRFLTDWLKKINRISPKLTGLAQTFAEACRGGKRIRGTLVKLGYEMTQSVIPDSIGDPYHIDSRLRGNDRGRGNDIFKIAAAYEIFHAAILAHDDIIDKSKTRRGKPSLYQALGGDHYGTSQAICLGDAGFFLATKIIAESDFADREKNQALRWFSQTMLDTAVGEMLDIAHGDVLSIMKLKTAKYTVSGPLILGAILAGAESDSAGAEKGLVGVFREFGENLGIAFQIQDDILGVFGSVSQIGKSITSDIEEGKNTLLITQALKKADAKQLRILEQYYGKGDLGDQGLEEVRKVFLETGSLDYSSKIALQYAFKAKQVILKMTKDRQVIKLLKEMIGYLVERNK